MFLVNSFASEGGSAIVDMGKIEANSKMLKKVLGEISKIEAEYSKTIKAKEEKINNDAQKVKEKLNILSSDQIKKEENRIKKDIEEYTKYGNLITRVVENIKMKSIATINQCVDSEIKKLSKKSNFDVVFSTSTVLYYSQGKFKDITDEITNSLDKSKCDVDVRGYKKDSEKKLNVTP